MQAYPGYISLGTDLFMTFHAHVLWHVNCTTESLQSASLQSSFIIHDPVHNPRNRIHTLHDGPQGLYLGHTTFLPKGCMCPRPFGAIVAHKRLLCQGLSPKLSDHPHEVSKTRCPGRSLEGLPLTNPMRIIQQTLFVPENSGITQKVYITDGLKLKKTCIAV